MAVTPQNKMLYNMKTERLSDDFKDEIDCFLDFVKVNRLNRHLRCMLLAYLQKHKNGFPLYHDALIRDLDFLFYLLDAAAKEQRNRKRAKKAPLASTAQTA
jgi:hypothetical protein